MGKGKVVVFFQPFNIIQKLEIQKNGIVVDTLKFEIKDISKAVKSACCEYDINDVYLVGNKDYLEKYKTEILTEYNLLNVNII